MIRILYLRKCKGQFINYNQNYRIKYKVHQLSKMTTQPKIDTSTGFLKIDCLNFDLMSSYDSENDSEDCAIMAPVVHERGQMSFFFELPTQEEIQEPKLTGKLEFQHPEPRRYSSATSERLAEDEDQGEELFNFELASVLSEEIDFDFHAS